MESPHQLLVEYPTNPLNHFHLSYSPTMPMTNNYTFKSNVHSTISRPRGARPRTILASQEAYPSGQQVGVSS